MVCDSYKSFFQSLLVLLLSSTVKNLPASVFIYLNGHFGYSGTNEIILRTLLFATVLFKKYVLKRSQLNQEDILINFSCVYIPIVRINSRLQDKSTMTLNSTRHLFQHIGLFLSYFKNLEKLNKTLQPPLVYPKSVQIRDQTPMQMS